jgi:hypothetical protein
MNSEKSAGRREQRKTGNQAVPCRIRPAFLSPSSRFPLPAANYIQSVSGESRAARRCIVVSR